MRSRKMDALQAVFDAVAAGNVDAAAVAMDMLALGDWSEGNFRSMIYAARRKAAPIPAKADPVPLKLPVPGAQPWQLEELPRQRAV